jgi:ABC-2 type transport system permease protein
MRTLVILWAEVRRTLRVARSYWLEYVADFALYVTGFLLLLMVLSAASDRFGVEEQASSLIGYVTWIICATVMEAVVGTVAAEARTGTLEQVFLSASRPGTVLLARTAGFFVDYGLRGLLMGFVIAAVLGILRPIPLLAVPLFVLTAAGACGLGFGLAGLTLVYNRVEGLANPLWQALVFFSGALAPPIRPVLVLVSRVLPIGWGIAALRAVVLDGASVTTLWQRGLLPGLLLNTMIYVTLGALAFAWGQKKARAQGTLAHY